MAKNLNFMRWLRTLTTTATATATPSANPDKGVLYSRLAALGDRNIDLKETLNEWVSQGKKLKKREILGIVSEFRRYKRYDHALQILEWMEIDPQRKLTASDHAIRLDLLSKAEGIESAEKYFASLPESAKDKPMYGALLHCYCKLSLKEKAMEIVEKMRELNIADTNLTYNNLMSLYMRANEPEKVPLLLAEMKEKNIKPDFHTYISLMNSYASLNNLDGVDTILEEMKDAGIKFSWITYTNLALIYVKAGLFDKANSVLEKLEKMDKHRDRKAYNMLIGLYAQTSNKLGVERVWESLKSTFPNTTNLSYLAMLQALLALGETDELQKCFEEWKSSFTTYDIRVPTVVIDSYLSRDMVNEANLLLEDATKRGVQPKLRTFETFMRFYLRKRDMDLALENFEGACSEAKSGMWRPNEETVHTFLKHFEEEKNVDGAERFYKSLKTIKSLNSEVYSSLLRTYHAAGVTNPDMRHRADQDGIDMNDEIEKLLETVCPN